MKKSEDLLTIAQVAKRLNVCPKTVRRYIADKMLLDYIAIPGRERVHYRFTSECIDAFIKRYSPDVKPEQRPRRAYHRRVIKGQRKKPSRKAA